MELCRFYKRNKIKRKAITRFKAASANKQADNAAWQSDTYTALQNVWKSGERLLYCDECVFTKTTIPRLDYAARYQNQIIDEKDLYHSFYAVAAAISADEGVDCAMIFDEAVNKTSFIVFLEELRRRNGTKPLHLYLDNLQVHKSPEVNEAYERLNIRAIYNPPYRYEFQPIEMVFSTVKAHYKK